MLDCLDPWMQGGGHGRQALRHLYMGHTNDQDRDLARAMACSPANWMKSSKVLGFRTVAAMIA